MLYPQYRVRKSDRFVIHNLTSRTEALVMTSFPLPSAVPDEAVWPLRVSEYLYYSNHLTLQRCLRSYHLGSLLASSHASQHPMTIPVRGASGLFDSVMLDRVHSPRYEDTHHQNQVRCAAATCAVAVISKSQARPMTVTQRSWMM